MLHFKAFQLWPEQLPRQGPLAREDMDACWRSLPSAGTLPALGRFLLPQAASGLKAKSKEDLSLLH